MRVYLVRLGTEQVAFCSPQTFPSTSFFFPILERTDLWWTLKKKLAVAYYSGSGDDLYLKL